jgi:hypothetical protein
LRSRGFTREKGRKSFKSPAFLRRLWQTNFFTVSSAMQRQKSKANAWNAKWLKKKGVNQGIKE